MNFVNATSFRSSVACWSPVRTSALFGRIGRISLTSFWGVVPSLPATEMASNSPSRSRSAWAVGIVKTANVAEPRELTSPYWASPTILKSLTGWTVAILTGSPIL